jgi:hypothetical protein
MVNFVLQQTLELTDVARVESTEVAGGRGGRVFSVHFGRQVDSDFETFYIQPRKPLA